MKVSSEQIVKLLQDKKAILVDIRFEEEQEAWGMDYALKMPLPTLPRTLFRITKRYPHRCCLST